MPTIHRFLYSADTYVTRDPLTPEFDYHWKLIKEGNFKQDKVVKETTKRWIAQHIFVDREGEDLALEPRLLIKKSNLTFATKFI